MVVKKMNAQNALKEVHVPLKILANATKVQLEPDYHALKQTLSYRCRKEFQNENLGEERLFESDL